MCQGCTFLEGRGGSAVRDMAPPLGAKFSETLFPHFKIDHKTPKIPPDMYKPLQKQNAKTPPLNRPSKIMAPVGLYLEIVLKFKKQTNKTNSVQ